MRREHGGVRPRIQRKIKWARAIHHDGNDDPPDPVGLCRSLIIGFRRTHLRDNFRDGCGPYHRLGECGRAKSCGHQCQGGSPSKAPIESVNNRSKIHIQALIEGSRSYTGSYLRGGYMHVPMRPAYSVHSRRGPPNRSMDSSIIATSACSFAESSGRQTSNISTTRGSLEEFHASCSRVSSNTTSSPSRQARVSLPTRRAHPGGTMSGR